MSDSCSQGITPETLSAWRSRLLSPAQHEHIAQHIGNCTACQAILARFERIAQALRTPPTMPLQEDVWRGVHISINAMRGNRMQSHKTFSLVGLGSAALIIALFTSLFFRFHSPLGTHPSATSTPTATSCPTPKRTPTPDFPVPSGTIIISAIAATGGLLPWQLCTPGATKTQIDQFMQQAPGQHGWQRVTASTHPTCPVGITLPSGSWFNHTFDLTWSFPASTPLPNWLVSEQSLSFLGCH